MLCRLETGPLLSKCKVLNQKRTLEMQKCQYHCLINYAQIYELWYPWSNPKNILSKFKKKKIWKIFPELSHGQAWTYRWTSGRTGKRTDGYTDEPTDAGNDNFPSASGLKVKKHIIYMGAISKVKTNLIVAHISLVSYYSKRFQYGEYFNHGISINEIPEDMSWIQRWTCNARMVRSLHSIDKVVTMFK